MAKKVHLGWADIDLAGVAAGQVMKVNSLFGPQQVPQLGFGEGSGGGAALGVAVVAAAQYSFASLGGPTNWTTGLAEWMFNDNDLDTVSYYDPLELIPFGFVNDSGEGYLQLILDGFYTVTVDATIAATSGDLSNAALGLRSGDVDSPAPEWAMAVVRVTDGGATGRTTVNSGPVWGPALEYAGLRTVVARLDTVGTLDTTSGGANLPTISGSLRLSYLGPIPE